jgi:hypothetical protein
MSKTTYDLDTQEAARRAERDLGRAAQIARASKAKVERVARLKWVPIAHVEYPSLAQREKINLARVDHIAADFDLEQLGTPTVNERDGRYYAIDGMHRIEALKLIGWGDQQVQCWTYNGLTDEEMAERFLKLNDTLSVSAFDKFRVGVNAGRAVECDIDRIVRSAGLAIGRTDDAIRAVGTLRKVYDRGGPAVLAVTVQLIRDTYGMPGFDASVIDGLGLFVQRYGPVADLDAVSRRLQTVHAGVLGLLGKAEVIRRQTKAAKAHCVAAAAVDVVNSGRGGKKLPSWFREDA